MISELNYFVRIAGICCFVIAFDRPVVNGEEDTLPTPNGVEQSLLDGLDDLPPKSTLAGLARLMRGVEQRIRRQDTSDETQQLQSDIAAELAKMLESAEQESARQSAATASEQSSDQTSEANPDGSEGDPRSGDADDTDDQSDLLEAVWGALPERLRQQIQSPLQEEFLPRYEQVIKQYYKRLAEEQRRLRD